MFCMNCKTIPQYENLSFLLSSPSSRNLTLFQNAHENVLIATHPSPSPPPHLLPFEQKLEMSLIRAQASEGRYL